jgi:uncharacterized membrane protein
MQQLSSGNLGTNARFWAISILSLVGVADALYLSVKHATGQSVRCTVTSGCDQVLMSPYSSFLGIPLAYLGLAAYFVAFSLAVLAAFNYSWSTLLLRLQVALMFLVTLWLLYAQAFLIGHFCQFCLISAAVSTLIALTLSLPHAVTIFRNSSGKRGLQSDRA